MDYPILPDCQLMVFGKKSGSQLTVTCQGELEVSDSSILPRMFQTIYSSDIEKVVFDFSGITYLDYSGVKHLIECLKIMGKKIVEIVYTHSIVCRILRLFWDEIQQICPDITKNHAPCIQCLIQEV